MDEKDDEPKGGRRKIKHEMTPRQLSSASEHANDAQWSSLSQEGRIVKLKRRQASRRRARKPFR
jgi:hypothetical protein